jgi:hypothetical protein
MAIDVRPLSRTLLYRFTRLVARCTRVCFGAATASFSFNVDILTLLS